ncbi:MAG: FAD-dependent oxidoreductase [Anaerolineae bacterium]|nr:FAD-dependent oxidoreductase [Anaerolineae bacterium]
MRIAIVGAGVAGLTAAYRLRLHEPAPEIVIFEKSRGIGGRMATRWYDRPAGRVYVDYGAQFLKAETETLRTLMYDLLPTNALTEIELPVWTFNSANQISAGDPEQNAVPRLSYEHGLTTLARLVVDQMGVSIKPQVRIGRLGWLTSGRYSLINTEGMGQGDFDRVLIATPAPQAADLIALSDTLPAEARNTLVSELQVAQYRRCLSIVLAYERPLIERPCCALLNTDHQHPIAWIGLEHTKIGHVPPEYSVLVVQMSGDYSLQHWDTAPSALVNDVMRLASELMQEDLTTPSWTDLQKWRFSQPDVLIEPERVNGVQRGLWFAGDYLRGGRVHFAAEIGAEVAGQLSETLPSRTR